MEISEDVDLVQKQVRARKKEAEREHRTGMTDMFASETPIDPIAGRASPEDVDRFWLDYLKHGIRSIDRNDRRLPRAG